MRKKVLSMGLSVLALAFLAGVFLPTNVVNAYNQESDKVKICHRTNSVNNPYVKIEVDKSAVDGEGNNDHTLHTGPIATSPEVAQALKDSKTKWGDIIPYKLNWDDVGKTILKNGCLGGSEIEEVVPAAVTFTNPTCDALGTYTIPSTENVTYKVNGVAKTAGTYSAQNGTTVTVVAEAEEGYYIADGVTDTWSKTFSAPTNCGGQVLAAQVTTTPTGGVDAGAGGASSSPAIAGIGASLLVLGVGVALRKFAL